MYLRLVCEPGINHRMANVTHQSGRICLILGYENGKETGRGLVVSRSILEKVAQSSLNFVQVKNCYIKVIWLRCILFTVV